MKTSTSAASVNTSAILGTYEGECADANITNKNGMDITRPVWENVFNSDDYKQAIELGWYIGFLGHPEDPNCMDFEHACIVMKSGYIDDAGKVHGKFHLIDTPVGRIVKAFQDAGVVFGISVRGAGDVVANSVDPDTFIFRGFDLVTFPAFPESIPKFTEVAASTDATKQMNYKNVCKAVKDNLQNITSCSTLNTIQAQFAKQSEEYDLLEARKVELTKENLEDIADKVSQEDVIYATQKKLAAVTQLYLDATSEIDTLKNELNAAVEASEKIKVQCSRKLNSVKRITNMQMATTLNKLDKITASYSVSRSANAKLKQEVEAAQKQNLKYKQKIDNTAKQLRSKEAVISSLQTKFDETVNEASKNNTRTSNLDAKCKSLESKITAAQTLLSEYQSAYAELYAAAVGGSFTPSTITATTTVDELQQHIGNSVAAGTNVSNVLVEPAVIDYDVEIADKDSEDDGLVTL